MAHPRLVQLHPAEAKAQFSAKFEVDTEELDADPDRVAFQVPQEGPIPVSWIRCGVLLQDPSPTDPVDDVPHRRHHASDIHVFVGSGRDQQRCELPWQTWPGIDSL